MTRLWAICNCDNSITFATAMLDQPLAFQDLVIVHELVHLRFPNHGVYFQSALTFYQPDWRAVGRLAPGSPAQCRKKYRVEDRAMHNKLQFQRNRATKDDLTATHIYSYRPDYGNSNIYRMD
jgi:Protein of unknown function DUF45